MMKRILILSMLLILVMSVSSFATKQRTMVMGNNNDIMVDDYNINNFYGRTFNYPNIALAELGNNAVTDFGMLWKFGSDNPWVLGTFFSTTNQMLPADYGGSVYGNFGSLSSRDRNIDLYYGRQLGGQHNFGFHFGYFSTAWENTDVDSTNFIAGGKENAKLISLGFGLTEQTGKWDVALDVSFGSWTDENEKGQPETESDGFSDVALRGRFFHVVNPTVTLVPHGEVNFGKHAAKDYVDGSPADTLDITYENKMFGFNLGLGMNYTPSSNVLAVCDVGLRTSQFKDNENWTATYSAAPGGTAGSAEWKDTYTLLPYWKIGLEADVFTWMDVRLGATSDWMRNKSENPTIGTQAAYDVKTAYASNQTYLGFGFNWGRLYVDTYTDPHMFLRGFDFISGNGSSSSGDEMNMNISVLYEMF